MNSNNLGKKPSRALAAQKCHFEPNVSYLFIVEGYHYILLIRK